MQGSTTPQSLKRRIMRGYPVIGMSVGFSPSSMEWGPSNHVKDAFTYRQYLVRLEFAQKNFVVSIKSTEASNSDEALLMAAQRATLSWLVEGHPLGNLMSSEVVEDTPENRKKLKVDGGEDRFEYSDKWRDAA